jgi:ATP-dependent Lon protease
MPRDKTDKSTKSPKKGKYNLRARARDERRRRKAVESSSSSDSSRDSESEEEESEDGEIDKATYRKFLAKLFPSRFMNARIEELGEEESQESEEECEPKPRKRKRRKASIEEETSSSEEDAFLDPKNNVNIVFSICEADVASESEEETESEEESDSECDEEVASAENKDDAEEDIEDFIKGAKLPSEEQPEEVSDRDILAGLVSYMRGLGKVHGNKVIGELEKIGKDRIKELKKAEEKADKKHKMKNLSRFRKSITERSSNDYAYFNKLTLPAQKHLLDELDAITKHANKGKPHRIALLEADIPATFKAAALKKINGLRYMEPGAGEYYKSKNWVDTFMRIPFGTYRTLPITKEDGVEKCHGFMKEAKDTLDKAVYGMNDAKLQIMQLVGQWITNPGAVGASIAIKGPMGTGKTTLVREGISKILNREFSFITLGGATDSSFLEGHSYTYEGSTWGKIVDILLQSKCMNPVIYFDELDKISETPKGEEIAGILTHLTDSSQNTQFHDKYFSEIDFDLSKCLFIFSYNDESKINPILRDRMYRIQTKGYDKKQKTTIARDYLLPAVRETVGFKEGDIVIPEEVLHYIISSFTEEEDGVRNLKRCLEVIHTKLNLYRLMEAGTNLFEEDMSIDVKFPFELDNSTVDKLLKRGKDSAHLSLYM